MSTVEVTVFASESSTLMTDGTAVPIDELIHDDKISEGQKDSRMEPFKRGRLLLSERMCFAPDTGKISVAEDQFFPRREVKPLHFPYTGLFSKGHLDEVSAGGLRKRQGKRLLSGTISEYFPDGL